ncbi:MAG: flavodoxin family protein [Saccharofermentanales bacterium]
MKLKVLGFCASPRKGNSLYLLEQALDAVEKRAAYHGVDVEIKTCSIRGKKLSGCVMCQGCMKDGICVIKDDFKELQDLWLDADVVLYSVPVYHMGVPAQLKAFFDRLGNSMFGRYRALYPGEIDKAPKPLKVIGCITQGIHIFSGQEHTMTQVLNHTLISGCIPVVGDLWEAYIGSGGWTSGNENRNALEEQVQQGGEDANIVLRSSISLAQRAIDMAVIVRNGCVGTKTIREDKTYTPYFNDLVGTEK